MSVQQPALFAPPSWRRTFPVAGTMWKSRVWVRADAALVPHPAAVTAALVGANSASSFLEESMSSACAKHPGLTPRTPSCRPDKSGCKSGCNSSHRRPADSRARYILPKRGSCFKTSMMVGHVSWPPLCRCLVLKNSSPAARKKRHADQVPLPQIPPAASNMIRSHHVHCHGSQV